MEGLGFISKEHELWGWRPFSEGWLGKGLNRFMKETEDLVIWSLEDEQPGRETTGHSKAWNRRDDTETSMTSACGHRDCGSGWGQKSSGKIIVDFYKQLVRLFVCTDLQCKETTESSGGSRSRWGGCGSLKKVSWVREVAGKTAISGERLFIFCAQTQWVFLKCCRMW